MRGGSCVLKYKGVWPTYQVSNIIIIANAQTSVCTKTHTLLTLSLGPCNHLTVFLSVSLRFLFWFSRQVPKNTRSLYKHIYPSSKYTLLVKFGGQCDFFHVLLKEVSYAHQCENNQIFLIYVTAVMAKLNFHYSWLQCCMIYNYYQCWKEF